jgi:FeS assembly SUF system regulator
MIRLTRLADYGIVLLTYVARQPEGMVHNVPELAAEAHLPLPTVSKVLKILAKGGLLKSHRGVKGGFHLAKKPEDIKLDEIVSILDGPIAITECSSATGNRCTHTVRCPARSNLQMINNAVLTALRNISLADMTRPLVQDIVFVQQAPKRAYVTEVMQNAGR